MPAQVITGNRLTDGIVVYLTPADDWSPAIAESLVCADEAATEAAMVTAARAEAELQQVVAPYPIDVATDDGIRPLRYREAIRAFGPSVGYGPDAAQE